MKPESIIHVGDKVTYVGNNRLEHGVVKSILPDLHGYVYVVYHCGDNWDDYLKYTSSATRIADLEPGWINDPVNSTSQHKRDTYEIKYEDSEPSSILPFLLLNSSI